MKAAASSYCVSGSIDLRAESCVWHTGTRNFAFVSFPTTMTMTIIDNNIMRDGYGSKLEYLTFTSVQHRVMMIFCSDNGSNMRWLWERKGFVTVEYNKYYLSAPPRRLVYTTTSYSKSTSTAFRDCLLLHCCHSLFGTLYWYSGYSMAQYANEL